MKKRPALILIFPLLACSCLYGQHTLAYGNLVKIKIDSGSFKGELYEISDSSITVFKRRENKLFQYPVKNINSIIVKSKTPVLQQIAASALAGAALAEILISSVYLNILIGTKNSFVRKGPPDEKALLYGFPTGAIIGFTVHTFDVIFIRIRIPVNKCQQLFEQKKSAYMQF